MIGTRIDHYIVESELGHGGMGKVYRARHEKLNKYVAIKVLEGSVEKSAVAEERFRQEAAILSKLNHKGLVEIIHADSDPVVGFYIVMELLEGETLRERLDRMLHSTQPMSELQTIHFGWQLASALHAVHSAGVVHRDLKPANIFLCRDEGQEIGERTKIFDFGIARLIGNAAEGVTTSGQAIGTADYMAPEQCRGLRDIDGRADVYSLGVILFECLAGARPFEVEDPGELRAIMYKHISEPPPLLGDRRPTVSDEVSRLINRMLAKSRGDRPSADEVTSILRNLYDLRRSSAGVRLPSKLAAAPLGATEESAAVAHVARPATRLPPLELLERGGAAAADVPQSTPLVRLWHSLDPRGYSRPVQVGLGTTVATLILSLATPYPRRALQLIWPSKPAVPSGVSRLPDTDRVAMTSPADKRAPASPLTDAISNQAFDAATRLCASTPKRPGMVCLDGGTFRMGNSESEMREAQKLCPKDKPDHKEACADRWYSRTLIDVPVRVAPFLLDRAEVTWAQFANWLNLNRSHVKLRPDGDIEMQGEVVASRELEPDARKENPAWQNPLLYDEKTRSFSVRSGEANKPAAQITYWGAQAYCHNYAGGRLPTEAEFEFAARGPERRAFAFGAKPPTCSEITFGRMPGMECESLPYGPSEVCASKGDMTPNGICDLAGNVEEWTADPFLLVYKPVCKAGVCRDALEGIDPYQKRESSITEAIVRGGNWRLEQYAMHAAMRARRVTTRADITLGFRCAVSLSNPN